MDISSFIQAIIDDPHDLSSRLVFADFLEEVGDPRAELVRLQLELADLPRHHPRRRKLRTRELKLVRQFGYFGEVPSVVHVLGTNGGFVDAIETTFARFVKLGEEIFEKSPIRKVVLTGKSKRTLRILDSPCISQLSSITFKNNNDDDANLLAIVSSDKWMNLEELHLRGEWVSTRVIDAVAGNKTLSNLTALSIDGYHLRSPEFGSLANSPYLTKLESLLIDGASNAVCELVSRSENFQHLRKLTLRGREITPDGMHLVFSTRIFPNLESLSLNNLFFRYYMGPSDDDFRSPFSGPTGVPNLTELELLGGFGDDAVSDILRCFANLEVLRLSENVITDRGATELAQSEQMSKLRALYLTNNQIGTNGARALGEAKQRNRGMKLRIDGNAISMRDATKLRQEYGKTFLTRNHFPSSG